MSKIGEFIKGIHPAWLALVSLSTAFVAGAGAAGVGLNALSVPTRVEMLEDSVQVHGTLIYEHITNQQQQDSTIACYLRALIEQQDLGPLDCRFGGR